MTLLIVAVCITVLIVLITWARFNPFLAFLVVSIGAGLWLGIPAGSVMASVQKGIGDMLGSLVIIICLGAMLGKLVAESGAAQQIADTLIRTFGQRYLLWAMSLTGFIVGIPLFYNVGFVLLVPLVFSNQTAGRLCWHSLAGCLICYAWFFTATSFAHCTGSAV